MSTEAPTSSGAKQRRERERETARRVIVAAAGDLGRTEGWDAVTMRRLADKIEYSSNFAYRYFSGRDDILLAVVRDGFGRLRDAMTAAASADTAAVRAPGRKQANAALAAVHAYIDFALAEPELYQLMYGLGGVRVATADTFVDGQAVGDVLIDLLADAGDTNAVNHVLQMWATVHGLIALLAVGRLDVDVTQLRTMAETAINDVLARALATPAPRRRTQPPRQDPS
jgi:AcrR family transcriptional regulator